MHCSLLFILSLLFKPYFVTWPLCWHLGKTEATCFLRYRTVNTGLFLSPRISHTELALALQLVHARTKLKGRLSINRTNSAERMQIIKQRALQRTRKQDSVDLTWLLSNNTFPFLPCLAPFWPSPSAKDKQACKSVR
jgi:hypothetical protein